MAPSALPLRGGLAPSSALHPYAGAPHEHGFAMLGAPGDFLMRRKSPKTHQEPPGSWTSGTRGWTPLDSPAFCPSGIVRGNLSPQASSNLRHLPCHGLTAGSVTSANLREKKRPVCPQTQVANRSGSVSEALFGGCGNAAGGTTCPPQGVQGHSPGTPLVPFVVKRKEPRVWAG